MPTMTERHPMLTPEQVAQILNITVPKTRRMLREGTLPGIKIGDEWRVEAEELEAFIEAGRNTKSNKR